MNIPWSDIELFLAIAESKSLSRAAKLLGVTQPTMSRRLLELEARLAEPLFVRSVEGVTLTAYGERLLEPARAMAERAGEVERVASAAESTPRGRVRITAPPGIAFDFLAPFAAMLRTRLPDIDLEVASTIHYVDLARRSADLALRIQPLGRASPQGDLVTLATLEQHAGVYGSPAYVASLPRKPKLTDIAWIAWAPPFEETPPTAQLAARIPGFRPVFSSDDFLVQLRAAEAGIGAIILGAPRPRLALPSPLVPIDLATGYPPFAIALSCARSSLSIPRVKAVADLLGEELRASAPKRAARGRRP